MQYRTGGKAHPRFEAWMADGLDEKAAFLSNEVGMDAILKIFGPGFKSLEMEWLVPFGPSSTTCMSISQDGIRRATLLLTMRPVMES